MSAIAARGRVPPRYTGTSRQTPVTRKPSSFAAWLGLFAILICVGYLAVHYRHEIVASLQSVNVTAVRYKTVGMLSVP
jgi:hypothetical protein